MSDLLFNSSEIYEKCSSDETIKNKEEGGDYACATCRKWFYEPETLKTHIQTIHNKSHKDHSCTYCEESFFHADHLRNHIRKIHEDCGSSKQEFEKHFQSSVHKINKDHRCASCGKRFSSPANLIRHFN